MRKAEVLIGVFIMVFAVLPGFAQGTSGNSFIKSETYELRIYFDLGYFSGREPQIKARIKVGTLFFARSKVISPGLPVKAKNQNLPNPLYIASGVLRRPVEGQYTLKSKFLVWWSPESHFIFESEGTRFELDKPQSSFSSDGIVHGYTFILRKVDTL